MARLKPISSSRYSVALRVGRGEGNFIARVEDAGIGFLLDAATLRSRGTPLSESHSVSTSALIRKNA